MAAKVTLNERRSTAGVSIWVVRWRSKEGKSLQKTFRTMPEAHVYQARLTTELHDQTYVDPSRSKERFGVFYARWVEGRDVSRARAAIEASHAKHYLLPRWADVPLEDIRHLDVKRWIKTLTNPAGAPAGVHTRHGVLQEFKTCLNEAVMDEAIRKNPAAHVEPPQLPRKAMHTDDVLESHELAGLVAAMPEHWRPLVYCLGHLGMRWSEALGLRVRDVDLEQGVMFVGQQVAVEVNGHVEVRVGGKTDAAMRVVPLPTPAQDVLRGVVEARFRAGGLDARVFVTASGTTPLRSNFRRVFTKALRETGLNGRDISVKQLRNTAITLMLSYGMDVLDVQSRVGHKSSAITLGVYARTLQSVARLAQT